MSIKTDILNFIGGVPDRVLISLPDPSVEKCGDGRETYLEKLDHYSREKWDRQDKPFFQIPHSPPTWQEGPPVPYRSGERVLITYPTRYEPTLPFIGDEFRSYKENLSGYINLWRHGPKPGPFLVLCIHGFMMGSPGRSEQIFRVSKMFDAGLDVALYALPHHWKRARRGVQRLLNPGNIPLTIESFGQNLSDLHSSVLLLHEMGYERIGIIGASMGGLTATLYATLEADVDFLFMAVPAVNMDHYLSPRQKNFSFQVDGELRRKTAEALELISPLHLEPRFDVSKICVVMHAGDRICEAGLTRQWISKWGIKRRVEVTGGHWLYLDRKVRGKTWYGWLAEQGYL